MLAVCVLSNDYFPDHGVSPRRMATSVGMMNLLCIPLGGIPMCHGAGGLAAEYRFGARSGGSGVMLGVLLIFLGFAFGCGLFGLLTAYPRSILAVMLIFSGGMLATAAKDSLRGSDALVVLTTGGLILAFGTAIGFLAGLFLAAILAWGKIGRCVFPVEGGHSRIHRHGIAPDEPGHEHVQAFAQDRRRGRRRAQAG